MKNLLKLKELKPLDKIVMLCVIENMVFNECRMTSCEIAHATATTKKQTLDSLAKLEELDFIKCKVEGKYRTRITTITNRFNNLI
jgi:transcription initiation factor IIE alpha subunit